MSTKLDCQLLPWDTEFFGIRIGRVAGSLEGTASVASACEWAAAHRLRCVYLRVGSGDAETIRSAEDYGFRFVDVRMTLGRTTIEPHHANASPAEAALVVRPFAAADMPALEPLAAAVHRDSRFFVDPGFGETAAAALFARWFKQSCEGDAQAVWVAALGGRPVGYLTCHLDPPDRGRIGLVGVAPEARGMGLGRVLLDRSLSWFHANGAASVTVVTQGRNVAALRAYERAGFTTRSVEFWYHKWLEPS